MLKKLLVFLVTLILSMPAFSFAYTLSDNAITSIGSSKTVWIPFASDEDKLVYSLEIKKYEYGGDGSFLVPYSTPSKWLLFKPTISWLRMSCVDEDVYDLGSYKDGEFEKQFTVGEGSIALLAKTFFCPIPDESGELMLSVGSANIDNYVRLIGLNPVEAKIKPFDKVIEAKTYFWHFEEDKVVTTSPRNYVLDCTNNSYKESLYNDGTNPYKKSEYMFQPIVNSLCLADDNLKLSGFGFDKDMQKFIILKPSNQSQVVADEIKQPETKVTLTDSLEKKASNCFKELPDKISVVWNRKTLTIDEISPNPLTFTMFNPYRPKNEPPYLVVNCESRSVYNKSGAVFNKDSTFEAQIDFSCKKVSEFISNKVTSSSLSCNSIISDYKVADSPSKPLPEIKPVKETKYKPLPESKSLDEYSSLPASNEQKKSFKANSSQKDRYGDLNTYVPGSKNIGSPQVDGYEEMKCAELGFKPKTKKHSNCVVKLKSKPSFETAQTQTSQSATERPNGDGSNEDAICQKYGFNVGDESYKNCRLELKIAQERADDQLRQYELQERAYQEQIRQYKEQNRIREASIEAARQEKIRKDNTNLVIFGLGLLSGRTLGEAAPALEGQTMYPRGYFNPPPLPPAAPIINDIRLTTPRGTANCQYNSTYRELRCY